MGIDKSQYEEGCETCKEFGFGRCCLGLKPVS